MIYTKTGYELDSIGWVGVRACVSFPIHPEYPEYPGLSQLRRTRLMDRWDFSQEHMLLGDR